MMGLQFDRSTLLLNRVFEFSHGSVTVSESVKQFSAFGIKSASSAAQEDRFLATTFSVSDDPSQCVAIRGEFFHKTVATVQPSDRRCIAMFRNQVQ